MTAPRYPLLSREQPAMGLILLRAEETIEKEFHYLFPPDRARLHVTRVDSGDDVTPETLAAMGGRLTGAAALLPRAADFDVVAYACTSGAAVLGPERVEQLVRAGVPTRAVTNPLTAAVARIADLGLGRVGVVSPYIAPVAEDVCAAFEARGAHIAANLSLNIKEEAAVARLDPRFTAEAARRLASGAELDGVFLSCTNLNTRAILGPLAEELGIPVLSSNAALGWHMVHLCTQP